MSSVKIIQIDVTCLGKDKKLIYRELEENIKFKWYQRLVDEWEKFKRRLR